jgi:hypothetical protein
MQCVSKSEKRELLTLAHCCSAVYGAGLLAALSPFQSSPFRGARKPQAPRTAAPAPGRWRRRAGARAVEYERARGFFSPADFPTLDDGCNDIILRDCSFIPHAHTHLYQTVLLCSIVPFSLLSAYGVPHERTTARSGEEHGTFVRACEVSVHHQALVTLAVLTT